MGFECNGMEGGNILMYTRDPDSVLVELFNARPKYGNDFGCL